MGAKGSQGINGGPAPPVRATVTAPTARSEPLDSKHRWDRRHQRHKQTIAPLSAKQGATPLPTGVSSTTVVELPIPAGHYVVFAKTELSQTGAGDSVECVLKSGGTTIDQAEIEDPSRAGRCSSVSPRRGRAAVPTQLTVQCTASVADGSANFNSLIAIPTA